MQIPRALISITLFTEQRKLELETKLSDPHSVCGEATKNAQKLYI